MTLVVPQKKVTLETWVRPKKNVLACRKSRFETQFQKFLKKGGIDIKDGVFQIGRNMIACCHFQTPFKFLKNGSIDVNDDVYPRKKK